VPGRGSPLVLGVRVALLLAATTALAGAVVLARARARQVEGARQVHACPMHPEVKSAGPGSCPVCGMALVLAATGRETGQGGGSGLRFQLASPLQVPEAALGTTSELTISREIAAPARIDGHARLAGRVVVAVLYVDEVAALPSGQIGRFRLTPRGSPAPAGAWTVRLDAASVSPWDQATVETRWTTLDGQRGARLPPEGETGQLELILGDRSSRVVPEQAVIAGPTGPLLLLVGNDRRTIEGRPISAGRVFFGLRTVLPGPPGGADLPGSRLITEGAVLYATEGGLFERLPERLPPGDIAR
jgi:hypothetical protein